MTVEDSHRFTALRALRDGRVVTHRAGKARHVRKDCLSARAFDVAVFGLPAGRPLCDCIAIIDQSVKKLKRAQTGGTGQGEQI